MNVDFPAPGAPEMPTRIAPPGRGQELVEQRVGVGAVVGAGRLDERDRPRERAPVAVDAPRRASSLIRVDAARVEDGVDARGAARGSRTRPAGCCVPGPKIARDARVAEERRSPAAGITPPTTTRMSSPPCLRSCAISSGTSVLCPAAWLDTPTTCTSFSIASRAASSGVWNSGPTSTSKPRSANAVAITLAPRSWPSWPSLATRMRGRRPSASANSSTSLADLLRSPRRPRTRRRTRRRCVRIVGAVARRTPPRARRRSRRPSPGRGSPRSTARAGCRRRRRPRVSASSAARHAASVARRPARAASRAICCSRTSVLSTSRTSIGASSARRYLLTPTIDLLAAVDRGLAAGRGLLDAQLRHARLDGLGHAAERLDLLDQLPRLVGEALRERLDVVRAAERIDDVGDAGLLGEDQLGVAGDAGRELASAARSPRRSELVCRLCVPPSTAASASTRGAHDVVVRVLLGERHARRLAVRAQHQRRRLLRLELRMITRAHSRRAARSFATSMKKFMPIAKKNERRPANSSMSRPRASGGAHVLEAVGERERRAPAPRSRPPPACGSRRSRSS